MRNSRFDAIHTMTFIFDSLVSVTLYSFSFGNHVISKAAKSSKRIATVILEARIADPFKTYFEVIGRSICLDQVLLALMSVFDFVISPIIFFRKLATSKL